MKLRPYQREADDAVLDAFLAGIKRTLVVLATGLGKTVCFAELVRIGAAHGRRMLVLAHRTELIEQAATKLRAFGVEPTIEQGSQRAGDAAVVVASVQTLRGARLTSFAPDAFDLIVIDEAHHATAASYTAILAHFTSAKVLGVTATPDRADGEALGRVFESVAYRYELRAAIRDGWLAPIRAQRVVVEGVDLGAVHTRAGDLDRAELSAVMADEKALHGVVAPLLELAGDRRTIVFAVDVAHATALAEVINRYSPGTARAVDGSASATLRAATLADFRAGTFRILVNCALFTEGFDEPSIACVAIARPTKSRALYTQMIGRGTRLAEGKTDCLVLDFTGMAGRHRLIGPADALAGKQLPDELRAIAERMLTGEQAELDGVLEAAKAEAEAVRTRTRVTAVARYRAERIDPFIGDLPEPASGTWADDAATERQRQALTDAGLGRLPSELSKGEAHRWLQALELRRQAGLATLKQVRLLRRYNLDARGYSRQRASQMLTWLYGDQPRRGVSRGRSAA